MNRDARKYVCWVAAALSPLWFWPLAWTLAFSRISVVGIAGGMLLGVALLSVFLLLACLFFLAVGPVALFVVQRRRLVLFSLVLSAGFVGSWIGGLHLHSAVCRAELAQVAGRGQPIVEAIAEYESELGRPPETLDALVPQYLDHIPETGVGAYPKFVYRSYVSDPVKGNTWELLMSPPNLPMGFDVFVYYPRQNYEEVGGGGIERIGTWAWVHE